MPYGNWRIECDGTPQGTHVFLNDEEVLCAGLALEMTPCKHPRLTITIYPEILHAELLGALLELEEESL
jgi:hypothetical protein